MGERLDIQSEPKNISVARHVGEGKSGDRFKPSISSAVESRLGPVPDDPSRSSIQSRLGPSPLQPVSSIQHRLGPKVDQSSSLPTEHSAHLQVSPAAFMSTETHVTPSHSEPLSDLRLKLQEQRRTSVDRDLKSSSSSPAQSLPLPGRTGSLSPVVSVRKPLNPLPLTPASKDPPSVLSPTGGKKQGLKSPQLQSHSLHKQQSHGPSKSRSATPTLVSPEGGKAVPSESKKVKAVPSESKKVKAVASESKKVKPITIKRPKTPTGTTLVQTVPVAAKKSTSPKPDSASPDTESSKALITSVSDQKTPPTKDHESSKEIVSELPASPLPTEMSAIPGMDAVIKPATSSIIKPSTFISKPVPSSRPMEAHAIASASNPSSDEGGATVKPPPASKTTRARHRTSDLPNPFSKVHASHVTTLKGTPSSAMAQKTKTPKSPPRERRRSGSSHTLSSAQQKHSSTHDKHTPQKRTPVTQPKLSPPHPMSDEEVAKGNTDPVKQAETSHSGNMAEHEHIPEHEHVPGSTGGTDVLNSSDQRWTQPSAVPYPEPVDLVSLSSSDTHTPPLPPLPQDVLPFSSFNETPQPLFPPHPPSQSLPIQREPPSLELTQLNPPRVEHSSTYSQPEAPQSYSVHVKESLVEKLDEREDGELDVSDDSDGGLVIDETASGTDDLCTETNESEAEAIRTIVADHMEIPPTADHAGITPLTVHMEIPPDHSGTPPVVTQTEMLGSSTSHPMMRPSQSPSAQLGTRNLIHKQPRSSLPSVDDLPQFNPQQFPRRVGKVESVAISTIGNQLVTTLNKSQRPGGKGPILLEKLYFCCVHVFEYKGRTSNEKVIAFMQKTFEGSAFARDVGPSWNPSKPAEVYVNELRHILHLCGDDEIKWWEQVNRFSAGARLLRKERNRLKQMMKEEKSASGLQEKASVFVSGKSQQRRKPRQRSHFKKATSKFGARASAKRTVPPPITGELCLVCIICHSIWAYCL